MLICIELIYTRVVLGPDSVADAVAFSSSRLIADRGSWFVGIRICLCGMGWVGGRFPVMHHEVSSRLLNRHSRCYSSSGSTSCVFRLLPHAQFEFIEREGGCPRKFTIMTIFLCTYWCTDSPLCGRIFIIGWGCVVSQDLPPNFSKYGRVVHVKI